MATAHDKSVLNVDPSDDTVLNLSCANLQDESSTDNQDGTAFEPRTALLIRVSSRHLIPFSMVFDTMYNGRFRESRRSWTRVTLQSQSCPETTHTE
jgi:hypothetical protein